MTWKDYIRFFYITSVCCYETDWKSNWVEDLQSPKLKLTSNGKDSNFGVLKFSNPVDIELGCILTFNQINARHIDETMRGCYQYAPLKVVIAKLINDQIIFIDGDYFDGCTMNLRLDKLTKGNYIIFYHYEWTRLHPVRKVIVNLYSPQTINM